jgi:hypothetical protein
MKRGHVGSKIGIEHIVWKTAWEGYYKGVQGVDGGIIFKSIS